MPPAKPDDYLTTAAKQMGIQLGLVIMLCGGALYVSSARAEERLAVVQRELVSTRDDLKLEQVRNGKNTERIVALELQIKTTEELQRLNANLEKVLRGRR
jgi:hypothetical protein